MHDLKNIHAAMALEFPSLATDKSKFSSVDSRGTIKPLKILFVVRRAEMFRFQTILQALARCGHTVLFLFDKHWTRASDKELLVEFGNSMQTLVSRPAVARHDQWRTFLFFFRELRTYRRYLIVEHQSPFYLKRWAGYLPRRLRIIVQKKFVERLLKRNITGALFNFIERMIPPDATIVNDIIAFAPDVVFASPTTLRFSSSDLEYMKAAKALTIPTAVLALTWDNLTTKGLLHVIPDRLFVWNTIQKKEAEIQHNVRAKTIVITGSPTFDALFSNIKPSVSRENFCKQYDLKSEYPFILYLGTSKNLTPDERDLIKSLRYALDHAEDKCMKNMQIVMRPHPANSMVYQGFEQEGIVRIPKIGETPGTSEALQLFYDSLFYAIAAVGVNTSAMIDAIIWNKPVVAFLAPRYKETQLETQHFQQLLAYDVVERATTPEECVERIQVLYNGHDMRQEKRLKLVDEFIRPRGREYEVADIIVQEIEKLAYIKD